MMVMGLLMGLLMGYEITDVNDWILGIFPYQNTMVGYGIPSLPSIIFRKKHKNICFSISFSMMIMSPFPNHIIPNDKKSPVAVPIMPKRRAAGTNASDHPAPLGFSSR
jgi:hypothetical protein